MLEKLERCFDRLQSLDIKPTLSNMEALLKTLYDLREVYNEITAKENAENVRTEGRPTVDSE